MLTAGHLEQGVELRAGLVLLARARAAPARARRKPFAAVGSFAVVHPLGLGLAAFVVGARVVVRAVPAAMQVGAAGRALLAKAEALTRRQGEFGTAGETTHAPTVERGPCPVKANTLESR